MRRLLIAIVMLAFAGAVPAQAETFRFTAVARCPQCLPRPAWAGPMAQALPDAFAAAGTEIDIDIEFLPWQRAVATARHDQAFAGYLVDDDTTMLRMLAADRMDAAVIDADVFAWQQRHAPDLAPVRISRVLGAAHTSQ